MSDDRESKAPETVLYVAQVAVVKRIRMLVVESWEYLSHWSAFPNGVSKILRSINFELPQIIRLGLYNLSVHFFQSFTVELLLR
jgi:hypothetical protein